MFDNSLRPLVIQTSEVDDNRDGIPERLHLGIQMPLAVTEYVTSIDCLLFHRVNLVNKVKYQFDSVSHAHHTDTLGMSKLTIDGNLILQQNWPLRSKGG